MRLRQRLRLQLEKKIHLKLSQNFSNFKGSANETLLHEFIRGHCELDQSLKVLKSNLQVFPFWWRQLATEWHFLEANIVDSESLKSCGRSLILLRLQIYFIWFIASYSIDKAEHYRTMKNPSLPQLQTTPSNFPQNPRLPTLPIIPQKCEAAAMPKMEASCIALPPLPSYQTEEKVIPGYNFQSLFRKKSHIRLARKKHKEQSEKRSTHAKLESSEKEQKNIQKGHWTPQENKRYHWFLEIHSRHFIFKHLRRTDKIFKNMAAFIGSREAEQCRSHHQKMQKKYHSFYQILLKLRMDFYSTAHIEELRQELEQGGFKMKQGSLITEDQLKNGDARRQSKIEQQLQGGSVNSDSEEVSQKQQNNLLNENYENHLDFHIPY